MSFELGRTILDGLHGPIDLTDEEMRIIDHPLFQRLRRLPQTGLLYLVAHSSTHTRFEHSIGVLHMADRLLRSIVKETRKDHRHMSGLAMSMAGQAVRLYELPKPHFQELRRLVRICALVHDLGHGPLSHTFDAFTPSVDDIDALLSDEELEPIAPYRESLLHSGSGRVEHEAMSCILFAKLWFELKGADWLPSLVTAVLMNAEPVNVPAHLMPWVSFIRDLMSSTPVDADRMDYLLRDSRLIGVSYGQYEVNRLLKSALCVRNVDGSDSYRLGWRMSGLAAVEDFVMARWQMYTEFYRHKTYRGIELMLGEIAEEALKSGVAVINAVSLDQLITDYLLMSDDIFLRVLEGRLWRDFPGNPRITALAQQIRDRHLWRRIYDFTENRSSLEIQKVLLQELQATFPASRFILDQQPLRIMKGLEHGTYLVPFHADVRYSCSSREASSWLDHSVIMRALMEQELTQARLYLKTDGESKTDRDGILRAAVKIAHHLNEADQETVIRD